jgi:hypothetical protein
MARKYATDDQTQEELISQRTDPGDSAAASADPMLSEGHDDIIEEGPGFTRGIDATFGDPADVADVGRSALLPDDLVSGDDAMGGDLTNPGGAIGSTLLDDLAGDLSDPTDGPDGFSDGGMPAIDDQSGWEMDGGDDSGVGEFDPSWLQNFGDEGQDAGPDDPNEPLGGQWGHTPTPGSPTSGQSGLPGYYSGDPHSTHWEQDDDGTPSGTPWSHDGDREEQEEESAGSGTKDDPLEIESGESIGSQQGEGSDDPPGSQTTPAPDDGTGGEPEAGDFIGSERGDVDPAPETEKAGGAGELIGGRGDVDPAPETEDSDAGGIDMVRLGVGVIDPPQDESTLLGADTGNLAEMATEADLADTEIEFDDLLVDADVGDFD